MRGRINITKITLLVLIVLAVQARAQNYFRVIEGIPHLPAVNPSTIDFPETGMLIFSTTDLKPVIYTGASWESLCTNSITSNSGQEYFQVKSGIPYLPAFSDAPLGAPKSGAIYYNTGNRSMMIYNGGAWTKLVDLGSTNVDQSSGFVAGSMIKTCKLPVLSSNPSPPTLSAGAIYINSTSKSLRYYDGSDWKDLSCRAIVKTLPLTELKGYTAMSGGDVVTNGGSPVTLVGICWSPLPDPDTTSVFKTKHLPSGPGTGIFTDSLTGLMPKTTYHVRAYAVNSLGIEYGEDRTFTTPIAPPTIITLPADSISSIRAVSGGNITADGGSPVTGRGIIWSSAGDPLEDPSNIRTNDGSGVGIFPSTLMGVLGNTTYYVRAYAINAAGTSYGNLVILTTPAPGVPVLNTTISIEDITGNTASGTALILNNGGSVVTERGLCYHAEGMNDIYVPSTTITPTDIGTFMTSLSGLIQGTTYYIKAYAKNSEGTGYSSETSFITPSSVHISTIKPHDVSGTMAYSGGVITNTGYSNISARGICWGVTKYPSVDSLTKTAEPFVGDGSGSYVSKITGLRPGVTYYLRAYAVNDAGVAYGNVDSIVMVPLLPKVSTIAAKYYQTNTITGGIVLDDGGAEVTARGVCWSIDATPTLSDDHTSDRDGRGIFTSVIPGLTSEVNYHIRAYAVNSAGIAYGNEVIYTIDPDSTGIYHLPEITTLPVTEIRSFSAKSGGNVISAGTSAITEKGLMLSANGDPSSDPGAIIMPEASLTEGPFNVAVNGLTGSTTYYVRAYAANSYGKSLGDIQTFTTAAPVLPEITPPVFDFTEITYTKASGRFQILNNGGAPVIDRGIRFSTDRTNFTYVSSASLNPTDIGSFISVLNGLNPNTTYYTQAYAVNSAGIKLSTETVFKTIAPAVVTTIAPNRITGFSAFSGGNIVFNGSDKIQARGVCWSTEKDPTISLSTRTSDAISEDGTGRYASYITGLTPGVKYYIKAYAVNGAGVTYGNLDSLITATIPEVTTTTATLITHITAVGGGTVTDDGRAYVTSRGVCWSTTPNPSVASGYVSSGEGSGGFSATITGLMGSTKYYFRAYAINSVGTAYGQLDSFRTAPPILPAVSTGYISNVGGTTATGRGSVTANGGALVTERGLCWSTSENPLIDGDHISSGDGNGNFSAVLTGLLPDTKYYVRAYAINSVGVAYGDQVTFSTFTIATVKTFPPDDITSMTAKGGGEIVDDGGAQVTSSGICWNTTGMPTVGDSHSTSGLGIGEFIHHITGLMGNTTYYVRAYAINSAGTAYGQEEVFTTAPPVIPVLTTTTAYSGANGTTALAGGTINSNGGAVINTEGLLYSITSGFIPDTVTVNKTVQSGSGNFTSTIKNLKPGTTYYVRAYATNAAGTGYGPNEVSFTTFDLPVITTVPPDASGITNVTVKAGGVISSTGGTDISESGICWSTESTPSITGSHSTNGPGSGSFTATITELLGSTKYYIRAYAVNSVGIAYGNIESFTTQPPVLATVTTTEPIVTSEDAATGGGTILSHGGALVTTRGICWSTEANFNPQDEKTKRTAQTGYYTGSFTARLTSLVPGTVYYLRAYAENAAGIAYGEELSFKMPAVPSLSTANTSADGPTRAIGGGNITDDGGADVLSRGVVWSTDPSFNPDTVVTNRTDDGGGSGSFISKLKDLKGNTTYYIRAYASNMAGTGYGNILNFITDPPTLATVSTRAASDVYGTTAITGGYISDDGGEPITTRGIVWSTTSGFRPDTVINNKIARTGSGKGVFTISMAKLARGTTYYVRAFAINSVGVAYASDEISFTTFDLPKLTTMEVSPSSTGYSAEGGGTLQSNGGTPLTDYGVCWSTSPNPTIGLYTKTTNDKWSGNSFYSPLNNLSPVTKYYVRAYASNSEGVAYGNEVTFSTPAALPSITTSYATPVSASSVVTGGKISNDGGAPVTARGVLWSTDPNFNPDTVTTNKTINGIGTGNFSSTIVNMRLSISYYIRAYATNSAGTAYGNQVTVTLFPTAPVLNTINISAIGGTSAMSGGEITSDGGAPVTLKGICWSTRTNPTVSDSHTTNGEGTDSFTASLTGLLPNTLYYVRAYAINKIGTAYGIERTVITNGIPTLSATTPVTNIIATTATSGGEITDDGRSPILERGICWSTSSNPTVSLSTRTVDNSSSVPGSFIANMKGLAANTLYYVRAYATNAVGTGYGSQTQFTTLPVMLPELVTIPPFDIDSVKAGSGGNITDDGGAPIINRGICWSKVRDFTISVNSKVYNSVSDTGSFTNSLSGLSPGTKYYVKAFATNSKGTAYGNLDSLITVAIKPTVSNTVISNRTDVTADGSASVINDGGAPVSERGFCWNIGGSPTISDNVVSSGTGSGNFTGTLTNLSAGQIYHLRAYATNSAGTAYGPEITFTTLTIPTLTTTGISGINASLVSGTIVASANSGGNITDNGGSAVIARGVCWSINPEPTESLSTKTSNGTGSGSFTSAINNLTLATKYYVRAYARNSVGIAYGNEISFTTPTLPVVTTSAATVSPSNPANASAGGTVTDEGGIGVTARGVCWSISPGPSVTGLHTTDGAGAGTFTSTITGLTPFTKYYVRAYATNAAGTAYGNEATLTTPDLPAVTTVIPVISSENASIAIGGGNVTDDGGAAITARGVCWSTTSGPVSTGLHTSDGTGSGAFTSSITSLSPGTRYFVRAYARNSVGTAYGDEVSFTTPGLASVLTYTATSSLTDPTLASGGGNVTDDGGAAVTARGVYWSTRNATPVSSDPHTSDGSGTGEFTSAITGLATGATYYVTAYATNAVGTAYGQRVTIKAPTVPTVVTIAAVSSTVDNSRAVTGGNITDNGGMPILARGVCWSTSTSAPTITGLRTSDGAGGGIYSSTMTGLANGTTYYVRAYATNAVGTAYGSYVTITTKTVPTLSTTAPVISADEPGIASAGGRITDDGGATVISRGVCWSLTNTTPTLADAYTSDGAGIGSFSSILTGLDASKRYYVRAYATNSAGTAYGNVLSPTTPTVSTLTASVSSTDNSIAFAGGTITDEGGAAITARGVCWSNVTSSPTIANSRTTNGTRAGSFNSTITGLANGTTYYIRAYATNAMGTVYGNMVSMVTKTVPTLNTTTPLISADEPGIASAGGRITDDGGATVISRGVCWSLTNTTPTLADAYTSDGAGIGSFSSILTGLDASKRYYVRAYATNSAGTAYGNVLSPTTPTVSTLTASVSSTDNSIAFAGGTITDEGGAAVTARGVCWSNVTSSPTIANSRTTNGTRAGSFNSTITGLANGTTYYIRAYATNAMGTVYGNMVSMVTKTIPALSTTTPLISADEPGIASAGGRITDDGGATVTERGACWSLTNVTPTLADAHTSDGAGIGSFSSILNGLDASKRYYVRAYATNSAGTAYGNVLSPTTPTVSTLTASVSSTDNSIAFAGGTITDEGGAAVTARGVCWSNVTSSPTIANSRTTNGTRAGSFNSTITELANGTTYYIRAYATNAMGTVYGNMVSIVTKTVPTLNTTTPLISADEPGIASAGGRITDDGGATVISRGVCWSLTNTTPTLADAYTSDGAGIGSFSSILTGLDASKRYYVRAYATNSAGTAYGNVLSPTTPTVSTLTASVSSTDNSIAFAGGTITDEGGAAVTARGVCWSNVTSSPTIANSRTTNGTRAGSFNSTITGLANGTTYYIRAYATNAMGTVYGNMVSMVTKTVPTLNTTTPLISADEPGIASAGGRITDDGGATVISRGVCWSLTNTTPTLADAYTSDGAGIGSFSSILNGLDASKRYYVRAYATNSAGTAYGNVLSPTTPTVSTQSATAVSNGSSTAVSVATVTDEGGAAVTARGVCWSSATASPTIAGSRTIDGTRAGSYTSTITGLANGTTYYIRAYATNALGTTYGGYVVVTGGVVSTPTVTLPSLSTSSTSISGDQPGIVTSGGKITNDGGGAVTERGVCWSLTNSTPTLADAHTSDGTGIGSFSSTLTGLDATRRYYVRAYATNSAGTAYGNVVTPATPVVATLAATVDQSNNSIAVSGGNVTSEGGAAVTARGICWSASTSEPVVPGPHTTDGSRSGSFSSTMTGLANGTTYYVRAYATNAMGTVYGSYVSFTTKVIPTLSTSAPVISADQPGVVTSGGKITDDGGNAVTERGVCWSLTNSTPTLADAHTSDGTGIGSFSSTLTGLDATRRYYVRAYATNSAGTAYGNVVTPTTPVVATLEATVDPSNNSIAVSGGNVTSEGGAAVTARGICWSASTSEPVVSGPHTTDGSRSGSFSSTMTGLVNGTTYYVRAYATNAMGTVYGSYVSFTTKVIPTLSTSAPVISADQPGIASSGGKITDDGGNAVTERGVCWSLTNSTPTLADAHTSDGTGIGSFSSTLTGLDATKKYYVRAYATNSAGTAYGNVVTPATPVVATLAATVDQSNNSIAVSGGNVTSEGGAAVTARGICWSASTSEPVVSGPHTTDGSRSGSFSSTMTGLVNGTTYYVRAYATNAMGTVYGSYVSFTTKVIPTLSTSAPVISADQPGVVTSGGKITDDGGNAVTERGVCWSLTNSTPTLADAHTSDGTGIGSFSSTLTGLDATKKYYVRAYATNSAGTAYGNVVTPATPVVATLAATVDQSNNSIAVSGGNVTSEGGAAVTARGICWSASTSEPVVSGPHTTDGSRSGSFSSTMTGLANGTTYYVRAYATNAMGTVYGSYVSFTTKVIPTLSTSTPVISADQPGVVTSGGKITDDGGNAVTERGVCWSLTNSTPTLADAHTSDGTGIGSFSSTLTGLDATKKYYVRAYATNSAGTAYGNVVTPATPVVTTTSATVSTTDNTIAFSGGTVTSEGGVAVTARGICWSTSTSEPLVTGARTTNGSRSGSFSSTMTGLSRGVVYYVRAYATSIMGTVYGTTVSFTIP